MSFVFSYFLPFIDSEISVSTGRFGIHSNLHRIMLQSGSYSSAGDIININGNKIHLRNKTNELNVPKEVFRGNFRYTGLNRSFTSRSAVTVTDKVISVSKKLSLITSVCEVPQMTHFKKAKSFLDNYKGRILKSSNKVKLIFTIKNMAKAYFKLDQILHECKNLLSGMCATLPIYPLLCNPCYLLIAYSSLKNKSSSGVDDVPVSNVTLTNIISMSKKLLSHEYSPKPTKRIFIRKSNGKMRPLGISSTQDKIVQQGIYIIFNPLFEPIFLNSSHGFRPKRGCHSALKSIYFK